MPAVLILVAATLLWAGNYVVGEAAVRSIDPLSLTWLRWVLAAVPLLLLAQALERPNWRAVAAQGRRLLLLALLGMAAYPFLLYTSLQFTTAVNSSVINASAPATIVVAAVALRQATAGPRVWAGVGVGLVGVLLVLSQGDPQRLLGLRFNTGDLLMVAAVLAWTAYTLLTRRLGLPVLASTAAQAVLTSLALAPVALVRGVQLPPDAPTWAALVFIALGASVGAYVCWNLAVVRVTPGTAGVALNLVTVFVMLLTALLGRPPTPLQLAGGAIVIGGVLLAQSASGRVSGGSTPAPPGRPEAPGPTRGRPPRR